MQATSLPELRQDSVSHLDTLLSRGWKNSALPSGGAARTDPISNLDELHQRKRPGMKRVHRGQRPGAGRETRGIHQQDVFLVWGHPGGAKGARERRGGGGERRERRSRDIPAGFGRYPSARSCAGTSATALPALLALVSEKVSDRCSRVVAQEGHGRRRGFSQGGH